jgi:site-specific DNA-cytosine methylase
MKILVACEESQAVTKEFRKLGHEAYSCDIVECSGGHPEWHLQQDVTELLKEKWDMILAFPPCTYLTSAGTRHYSLKCNPKEKVEERIKERIKAIDFFMLFANADCEKIAIENPVGYMNTHYKKPNQIIHPYYFGDNVQKRTCLWLKGLPNLEYTDMLPKPEPLYICQGEKCKGKKINWCEASRGHKGISRAMARSKTFPGIAKAMAEQWGR